MTPGRVDPASTLLFVCDIQERFRTAIHQYPAVIETTQKLVKAAKLLEFGVVTTEQNPKALGQTVPEIGLADIADDKRLNPLGSPLAKTRFSMVVPGA